MFLLGSRATDSLVSTSTVPCRQQGRSLVVYVVRITLADIGARVVIRRRITGPVPLTDVIGTLRSWTAGVVTVDGDDGTTTEIPETDLVAAKTIPPRPARRRSRDGGPTAEILDPAAPAAPGTERTDTHIAGTPGERTDRTGTDGTSAGSAGTHRADS
jgi:hypothetical protein